ncbi:Noc2-domain-containing protein [Morchella conica CCBAS932]|uniref:Noc2-domain-containing protein n=1 Tax=Morchella conica CCBAS932 TaxID=1392247 RepID=A0A3N4L0Q1_9PEZI|nr:Noc2-domain-containing protein [Morchella conica CCBAS932]
MGRIKKSTRKFEKNHLKDALDQRKAQAKIKQQFALRDRNKKRRKDDLGITDDDEAAAKARAEQKAKEKRDGPELFEDMSVEQFFQGGFEIPEAGVVPKKGRKGKKEKKEKVKEDKKRKRDDDDKEETAEAEAGEDGEDEGEEGSADELEAHMKDLSALAEKDPEFFKYLKENDAELLDFTAAEHDDLAAIDDLSDGENDNDDEESKKKTKKRKKAKSSAEDANSSIEVTLADVAAWKTALTTQNSLRALRNVVLAFRAAAHVNDVQGENTASSGGYKYSITNPDVYHELLIVALKHVPDTLNHHLPVKESANGRVRVAMETKKYRTLNPLVKSHSASLLHLLPTLTDPATQRLLLNSAVPLVPYFLSYRKFLKTFVKTVTDIWCAHSSDETTRITAFLVIRRIAVVGDEGLKDICAKALYAGLVKASRQTSGYTMAGINLMKNSAAEVFGMEGMEKVGYQVGFGYIRQLAVHLRNSITNNSKESYKTIYNWQYIHSLDFFSRVLSTHCDTLTEATLGRPSPLRPLIYPLIQVTLGAIRLIPTAQYFPLRFYLTRSLLRISRATDVYIPLSPLIFEVLSSAELKKKPKPSTLKPLDFSTTIRAPKSYLRSRTYQDGICEQVVELLSEFYVLHAKSIAFPELAIPAIVLAKRAVKKSKNAKLNNALAVLVAKLEANSKYVQERRSGVEFSPDRVAEAEAFLREVEWERTPLGAYVVSQRKVREEKMKMLEESMKEERARGREEEDEEEEDEVLGVDASDDEEEGDDNDDEEEEDEEEDDEDDDEE